MGDCSDTTEWTRDRPAKLAWGCGTQLATECVRGPSKLRKRMTAVPTRRSQAPRAGVIYPLLPRGRATPETLLYLAGCAMLIVAVLLGLLNWKPRYSSTSEPMVVWKSDEPRLLRDTLQTSVLEGWKVNFRDAEAANLSASPVPCTELAESWFRPVANPLADGVSTKQEVPLACDWVPGEPQVVIIDR